MVEKKFYELNRTEKINKLSEDGFLTEDDAQFFVDNYVESDNLLDKVSENVIGGIKYPFSVVGPFIINGKKHVVPMSTEESSVVAAANNGAQRMNKNGGIKATMDSRLVVGQIVYKTSRPEELKNNLTELSDQFSEWSVEAHPSLTNYGGGLKNYAIHAYDEYVEIELNIDTGNAMGANIVNSICEYIAIQIDSRLSVNHLFASLSNEGKGQLVIAKTSIYAENLATKDMSGNAVAKKIVQISKFGELSNRRGVTNNKGILNGVFAVATATGNDTRVIASSVADYQKENELNSLSKWEFDEDTRMLNGTLKMPVPVGIVGGSVSTLPTAQIALNILNVTSASQLSMICAGVGLANNLSALRALVSTGIQEGHMKLQSSNLAINVGAKGKEIDQVAERLIVSQEYNLDNAERILKDIREEHK